MIIKVPDLINKREDRNGNATLHIAAQNGHVDLVKLLLLHKANIDIQNKSGQTSMHMAISYDLDEVIDVLRKGGCDENRKNEEGFPAIHGLEGEKNPSSGKFKLGALKAASTETEFMAVLESLKGAQDVETPQVVQTALARKRECKAEWSAAVQAKLGEVMASLD
eukprot:CAMPEP_0196588264 /NCGR_PEP_ID=MMETSP1081-20130531/60040_1 /TAXON_ID=36882 /ORGANISM="Pyramimonas amylifera, Strain CCMP720" /LENGTH=164 /DNA_ID=CAMNT_0041910713 /DNA_START=170 /DNA_END=664 /DNA_ORIENTATION=+